MRCQQDKVYEAETLALAAVTSEEVTVAQAQEIAGTLIDSWQARHNRVGQVRAVEVHTDARQEMGGVARRTDDFGHIEVPGDTITLQLLCHEVAHILVPKSGHGAAWARAYLELVYEAEGTARFVALHNAFGRKEVEC